MTLFSKFKHWCRKVKTCKKKYNKYEEVCLNCIDPTNDNEGIFLLFYSDKVVFSLKQFKIGKYFKSKIINLFTLAEK